jgi:D-3-phosphoglycerate dehydrogenase
MHKNIPNMLSQITAAFSQVGLNIENLANGSKGEYAYTIAEIEKMDANAIEAISKVEGVSWAS